MEIKLTNFWVFLKVYQTHKKKARKINYTSMDNTMKEYEHRHLAMSVWVNINVMSVRNTYSPKLRLLA